MNFKYLFKDESGNLSISGIKYNLYVTDSVIDHPNPLFYVISQDNKHKYYFTINHLTPAGSGDPLNNKVPKKVCKAVYDYVTNNQSIWAGIHIKPKYSGTIYFNYNIIGGRINEFGFCIDGINDIYWDTLILDNKMYEIYISNDYINYPIIHISLPFRFGFDSMYRLDTFKYYGGDKLTKKEQIDLHNYLSSFSIDGDRINNHDFLLSLWKFEYDISFGKEN